MLQRVRNIFSSGARTKEAPWGMQTGIIRGSAIGELPRLGTRQLIEGYNLFPWLRAVVDKISEIGGTVDWTVSVKQKGGDLKVLEDHPLVELINGGNSLFSGIALRQLALKHLLIAGEFVWLLERNKYGMPIALWPIPPSWVTYAPTFQNAPDAQYKIQYRQWHALIPATEVVHIYEPNPAMPYGRGSGRGATLGDELETDEYAARYMKTFFYNSARPDLLISSASDANPMSPESAKILEQKWSEKLQGWWKAFRPYFLSGGSIKIDKLTPNMSDLDVTNIRKGNRDIVLQMYGLPPEALGILDNSNRATIDMAEFFLTKHVVVPKLTFVRAGLQHRLVKEFDLKLILGFNNPVQVDKESRLKIMQAAPFAFSIDDIRVAADVKPLGSDSSAMHAVPLNMQLVNLDTLDGLAPVSPTDPSEPQEPDTGDPADNPSDPQEPDDNPKPSKALTKQLSDEESRKVSFLVELLTGHPSLMLGLTWALVLGQLDNMVQAFGAAEFLASGASGYFVLDPQASEFIKRWGTSRGLMIDRKTGEDVAYILKLALEQGWDAQKLRDAVNQYFIDMGARIDAITVTETGNVASIAQLSAFSQMGTKAKEWLSQRDDRVRDTHNELDGTVVPLRGKFMSISGATADAPRQFGVPEEDVNCRCFLLPATMSNISESAKDQRWKTLDNETRVQEQIMRKTVKRVFNNQKNIILGALPR